MKLVERIGLGLVGHSMITLVGFIAINTVPENVVGVVIGCYIIGLVSWIVFVNADSIQDLLTHKFEELQHTCNDEVQN